MKHFFFQNLILFEMRNYIFEILNLFEKEAICDFFEFIRKHGIVLNLFEKPLFFFFGILNLLAKWK